MRNSIQHFANPRNISCGDETLTFIYTILDTFIAHCWGLYATDYTDDYDDKYLFDTLINRKIVFTISPRFLLYIDNLDVDLNSKDKYIIDMNNRIKATKEQVKSENKKRMN